MELKEEILQQKIKDLYDNYIKFYGNNQILGVFLVGLGNYGFAESEEELKFIIVYLPTFEELCTQNFILKRDNFEGELYDARRVYTIISHNYDISLELLYTNYYFINPKYRELWNNYFYNNRNKFSVMDKKERLKRIRDMVQKAFNQNNYFEAMRLYIAASLYVKEKECDNCFHIKDPIYKNFLWDCKHGKHKDIIAADILSEIDDFIDDTSDYIDYNADKIIKTGVLEIMSSALRKTISYDAFIGSLTPTELRAWETVRMHLKRGEKVISISKLLEETKISRPIFKNLFSKMEQDKIAIITNMGAKGTEIKLTDFDSII